MKRLILLFLTLMMGFGSLKVSAQVTLTVADGTQSNYYVPIYGLYMDYYLRTQIIYPESMLTDMVGGTISELSFYFETPPAEPSEWTSTMNVGMAIVNQSTFNYDFLNIPTDIVYTGTLNASTSVMTITLTTPYIYTGGNLLLEFTTASTPGGYSSGYFYGVEAIGASVTGSNSSSLSGIATANSRDFIPKTTFTYSTGSLSCPFPGNVNVANIGSNDANLSWSAATGVNTYLVQYKPSTVQSWNSSSVISDNAYDTTYSFSGTLNPSTTYNVRVASLCDAGDTSIFKSKTFTTACGATSALPITEDFDGFSHTSNDNNVLPDCWDYLNTGTSSSNHPTVYYSSSNAHSGSYSLRFYTGSGSGYSDQYVFLPALDLNSVNIQDLSLGVYMRRQGNSGTFRLVVGVTEGTDTTTFVAVDTLASNSGTHAYREASFGSYSGSGDRICLKAFKPASGNNRGYVDDLVLGANLCATPANLTMTDADEYSITLQWSEVGTASVWEVEYGPVGFATGSGTTVTAGSNPFTISGLNPATTYAFQVRSDCGGNTSDWSSRITASTTCIPLTAIPFSENFDSYTHTSNPSNGTGSTNVPLCWDTYNSGSSYPAYPYVYYSTSSSYSGNYSLRFYASSGSNYADQYAILPALDYSIPLNTLQVSMMARSNSATTPFILVVGEMSGGPSSFEAIDTLTITGTTYNAYIAYLDGYTGSGNRIALKAPKLSSNNRGNVDDIVVELLSNCRMVSNLHVSDVTTNSADVSWTSNGDETSWIVEYRASGDSVWQSVTATTNPYVLTGLNNATTYHVHVSANCGTELSNATANVNFTTLTCDTADQCLYTFALTDGYGDGWNGASITVRQNGISVGTMTLNDDYSTTVQLALCDGLTTTISWSAGSFDDECSFTITDPFGDTFYSVSDPSAGTLTSFTPSCVQSSCARPSSISVTSIGATTATVSWVPTGNESAWNVEYKPSNSSTWTVEPTTSNPHILYGLTASTNYDIRVQADCGDELSAYRDGSFSTAGCEVSEQCPFEFVLTDGFGDGWNGAALNVMQNGVTVATMTVPASESTATYQLALCDSSTITLTWTSGSYDSECSFVIYNAVSDAVYTSGSLNSGTITTFTADCTMPSCAKPYNLTVTNVGATSATVGWTVLGTESAWNVEYKPANSSTWITEPTTSNPHVLYGLTASTAYDVRVQADCGGGDLSDWREGSFQTQCDLTSLPYSEAFESYAGTTYDSPGPTPACWTTYSDNTSYAPPHVISGGSYFYSASGNSLVFTSSSSGAHAYAALPTFEQPLNTLTLNFWRAMENTSYGELFVGYVTDLANIASSFVTVAAIPSVESPGDTISVDFTGADIPAAGNICFYWYKESTYYSCFVDNVNVTSAGGGPVVNNPTVATNAANPVAQTTATLHATITNPDNVTISAKGFEWKATAGGSYTQIAGTGTGNGFTANLTNLTPSTGYTYKAFITFNGTTVYGSEMTFTTLEEGTEPCNVPTGLTASDVQGESITITWNNDANVSNWNIQYRPENGQLSSATSNTNSYTISGLTGGTTYQIQVQANCGDGNLSDWSSPITVTTTGITNW